MEWTQTLLAGMTLRTPGVSADLLAEAEEDLGQALPDELAKLYAQCDGGAGKLGAREFVWWSLDELVDENIAQEVTAVVPGLLLIGTDAGTEAVGFLEKRYPQKPWGRISLMAGSGDEFQPLAATLAELLDALSHGR